jgi:hypothetical protein
LTAAEVDDLAHQFATAVPHSKYSTRYGQK